MYEDDQYIKGVHAGDRDLFTELVRQYLDPLVRFVLGIVGSDDIAHDIVQDVLVSVWSKGKNWNPKSTVSAYLFRAVRNRALDLLKIDNNRQRLEMHLLHEMPSISDPDTDTDFALIDELNSSIGNLTDRQRQAVHLRYYQGMTIQEVSQVLGIDIRATRRLLARSLSILQHHLSPVPPPEK